MKQFIVSVALTIAAGISAAQADGCKSEEIEPLLTKFFATTWSKDCEAQLKAMDVDEVWLTACRKAQKSPNAALLMEMNRRTKSTFKELRSKDGRDYAMVEISGPEMSELMIKQLNVHMEGDCVAANNPFTQAVEKECGEEYWSTIPIRTRPGAVPLSCEKGKWRIVAFP
jgi:hypothetical protein